MLLEIGIPDRVIDHWNYKAELGPSSLVLRPTDNTSLLRRFHLVRILAAPDLDTELQCCNSVCLWLPSRYAWGRKLLADGTAAPHIPVKGLAYRPIPPHLGGQTPPFDPFGPYGKYPLAHYYPTAERARQWMEWRALERARLGCEPWPNPWK